MKTTRYGIVISCIVLVLFSCQKEEAADAKVLPVPSTTADSVYHLSKSILLQLVNEVRSTGCTCGTTIMPTVSPVEWNDQLAQAANIHSLDMLGNNYFDHAGSDGSNPGTRITAAGYSWHAYGENIAKGYLNETAVMKGWINSEDHCKNIMSPLFVQMGAAREGDYWTQDFGRH